MSAKSKINRIITASCMSVSGKYQLILAEHIVKGKFCFDVIAFNNVTREVTSRHYRESLDDSVNRAEALRIYDEYRELITTKSETGDDEELPHFVFVDPGKIN